MYLNHIKQRKKQLKLVDNGLGTRYVIGDGGNAPVPSNPTRPKSMWGFFFLAG